MTVADLKRMIAETDDNAIVVLSRDSEGNGYSPLYDTAEGYYHEGRGDFYGLHDAPDEAVRCLCLWPVT